MKSCSYLRKSFQASNDGYHSTHTTYGNSPVGWANGNMFAMKMSWNPDEALSLSIDKKTSVRNKQAKKFHGYLISVRQVLVFSILGIIVVFIKDAVRGSLLSGKAKKKTMDKLTN